MPKIDTSLGIVGIIAIVALLSPPITAIIENLFKLIAKWIDCRMVLTPMRTSYPACFTRKSCPASRKNFADVDF